jgi:hypothetical protein
VQEIILPKNMFGCPLKLILGFYGIFYISDYKQKYSYTIMYGLKESWLNQIRHIEWIRFNQTDHPNLTLNQMTHTHLMT